MWFEPETVEIKRLTVFRFSHSCRQHARMLLKGLRTMFLLRVRCTRPTVSETAFSTSSDVTCSGCLRLAIAAVFFSGVRQFRLWHVFSTRRGIVQRFTLVYLVWIGCGGFQYINFQNFLSNSSGYLQQSYAFSDISSLNHVTSCVPDNKSLNCSYQFHKVYFSWHLL